MGCSFAVNLNRGPNFENLLSSLLIADTGTAVFCIATHGCQNCRSINDTMWLFNSLHFAFVVSLPSISKMLVLGGYKKQRKEKLLPGMFLSIFCSCFFFFVLRSEIFLLCSQMFLNPIFIQPKGFKSQVRYLPWWLE